MRDVITGEEFDVRAKCVVNATGPFTDTIRKMDDPTESNICQPSSGVHVVLPEYYRYLVNPLTHHYSNSPYWSPYISLSSNREHLFRHHDNSSFLINRLILMTFMCCNALI